LNPVNKNRQQLNISIFISKLPLQNVGLGFKSGAVVDLPLCHKSSLLDAEIPERIRLEEGSNMNKPLDIMIFHQFFLQKNQQ